METDDHASPEHMYSGYTQYSRSEKKKKAPEDLQSGPDGPAPRDQRVVRTETSGGWTGLTYEASSMAAVPTSCSFPLSTDMEDRKRSM